VNFQFFYEQEKMMGEKKNDVEIAILKCASKLAKSKITARKK
jgi:hypothetical protein